MYKSRASREYDTSQRNRFFSTTFFPLHRQKPISNTLKWVSCSSNFIDVEGVGFRVSVRIL